MKNKAPNAKTDEGGYQLPNTALPATKENISRLRLIPRAFRKDSVQQRWRILIYPAPPHTFTFKMEQSLKLGTAQLLYLCTLKNQ